MRKAKRILSLVLCLAMVIMTVPAFSLVASAASEGATVGDGSNNFTGTLYSSSNIYQYVMNVPSKFGKTAEDVVYDITYKEATSSETQLQTSGKKNATYFSMDVAFTSADEEIVFQHTPYLTADATSASNYAQITLSAAGVTKQNYTAVSGTVPAFELNKWYNIAFVDYADGTADSMHLYVNGVDYPVTQSTVTASYGAYRSRLKFSGNSGRLFADNIIQEVDATGENAYDPSKYVMNVDVSAVEGASIDGSTLTVDAGQVTLAELVTGLADYTVKGYTDETYATELASDAVLAYGDVIVVSNANGAFRYYTVKEKLVVSSSATVYDGTSSFWGTIYSSNILYGAKANQAGVLGKPASDVIYDLPEKTGKSDTRFAQANAVQNEAYVSMDIAFTDATAHIKFEHTAYSDASGTVGDAYSFIIGPSGLVSKDTYLGISPSIPAFNLNEWYNIAIVGTANGTSSPSYLYINGVRYTLAYGSNVSYGNRYLRVTATDPGTGVNGKFYADNLVIEKNATGDYAYDPARHTLADITSTSADVTVNADGDLRVNNLEMTAGELMASLENGRNNAVLYTDRTYAAEVASDAVLSELETDAVLVYSNQWGAYRYYDIVVTDEADATGINTGDTDPDFQGDSTATANVAGSGVKTADDVVISLGTTSSTSGIKYAAGTEVMEMALQAPEAGYVALNALSYYDAETKDNSTASGWYTFALANDGFYTMTWNGALANKIASAEAGRWYNVALVMPEIGSSGAADLYIDGVKYQTGSWPLGGDGFQGTRRSMLFCSTDCGTAYVDNIRAAETYSTKYELPAEVSAVADSGVEVLAEDKAIMFEDELAVSDLVEKLSIDERAHANVRVYEDGTFATLLGDEDVVNDGAVVVVAAKNGYTFERVYSYYVVNPVLNTTIFDYAVIDEEAKTAKITGFLEKNITEETDLANIEIPSEIMGYAVVEIGEKAFMAESTSDKAAEIRTVVIPEGVTTIGAQAFRWNAGGNGKITAITLPDSIEVIGDRALYNLASVTELNLTNNLKTIGTQAFYGLGFSGEVVIPASVTSIGSGAFTMTKMSYFEFEDGIGITSIPNQMFKGCSNLKTLVIPDEITAAGTDVFADDTWGTTSTNITIYGVDDSFAETFAADEGRTFVRIIDGIVVMNGALMGDGVKALNGTNYDINYGFTSVDYTGTIRNYGAEDKTLKAVVVLFDGNDKMLARVEDEVIVAAGAEVDLADEAASLAVDGLADGQKVKAFLWDATSNAPVSDGVAVELDADAKELHLLTIGNSFTNDSVSYINEICEANDVTLKRTTLYIGSSTLKAHYDNMTSDAAAYNGRKIGDSLLADKWDVVTVQAATHGQVDYNENSVLMKYGTDEADEVFAGVRDYIAERAPEAKRVMHMTWVPCDEEAVKMYGAMFADRAAALEGIKAGYEYASSIISTEDKMMIPTYYAVEALVAQGIPFHSGEATSNVYENPTEMSIFRDETCHLTYDGYGAPYGRVLAALTWFEYLTGIDARTSTYTHAEISEEEMDILEAAAHDAQQYVTPLNLWGQN